MKRNSIKLLTAAILLAGAQTAMAAAGVTAGTNVANSATVNYKVGGIAQTAKTGTADFLVDRLLNVTVAEIGGTYTDVAPGATGQALLFTVTNNTNDVMDIGLTAANTATDPWGGTDNFNIAAFTYYIDDGDGIFEPGVGAGLDGAAVTFLDERAKDQVTRVWVVGDIPAGQADGDIAAVALTATLRDSTGDNTQGAVSTQDAGANVNATVQNVFGDAAGVTDIARDGKHSASDAYKVKAATIAVSKTAVVFSDPVNGTTNPKAIPGALIIYCISVANTGGTAATAVSVDDAIPTNTTYVAESIRMGASCNYSASTGEDDNNTGADDTDGVAANKDGTGVHSSVTTLGAGSTTTTLFQVTVD